jgi:hypothetical protein
MAERKKPETILQRLIGAGEEKIGQLAEELLSNPHVSETLANALRRAARTKGQVDRNMQLVLGALNLPSRGDVSKLMSKIEALQGSLVNLNIKVDRLMAEREVKKRPPARRPARARKDSTEEGEAGY